MRCAVILILLDMTTVDYLGMRRVILLCWCAWVYRLAMLLIGVDWWVIGDGVWLAILNMIVVVWVGGTLVKVVACL